jgi:hypothetical protein
MPVLALQQRDRSFRMVLGGFKPSAVRAALESASTELERLRGEIAHLQQQHAEALAELERIAELERSLVRACVAAEEDAQIRSAAARRYAARIVAAAQHEAAARLEASARERDRLAREIDEMRAARGRAGDALELLIANLHDAADAKADLTGIPAAPANDDAMAALDKGEPVLAAATAAPIERSPRDVSEPRLSAGPIAPRNANAQRGEVAAADVALARGVPRRRRVRRPLAAGAAAAVLLVFQGSAGAPPTRRGAPEVAAAGVVPVAPAAPNAADAGVSSETRPDQRATVDQAATGAAPAAGGLTMRIKPLRRCWVRVVVDDHTDARELMPGEDIRLDARRTILLRAGDAGALSIELNGRVLPPLGDDGQVVERRFSAETK